MEDGVGSLGLSVDDRWSWLGSGLRALLGSPAGVSAGGIRYEATEFPQGERSIFSGDEPALGVGVEAEESLEPLPLLHQRQHARRYDLQDLDERLQWADYPVDENANVPILRCVHLADDPVVGRSAPACDRTPVVCCCQNLHQTTSPRRALRTRRMKRRRRTALPARTGVEIRTPRLGRLLSNWYGTPRPVSQQ